MSGEMESSRETRHTCLKLELSEDTTSIFVMGTWFPCRFALSISDGLNSWICDASEEDVSERASQWDQSVAEYIQFAESYLGFQQPASVYRFADAGNGQRRLSWTFEKEGTTLEWRWRCKPSPNPMNTTSSILDFLMASNIRLSDELVQRDLSNNLLQMEANKCLLQSEMLSSQKYELETQLYAKFVSVLNSKKAKLRELRDRLSKQEASEKKLAQEEDVSTDGTKPYQSETDYGGTSEEKSDGEASTSPTMRRGRKRNSSTLAPC